ncbi:MAG: peptidoglycan DD-metalloendopeptidase family protein [Halioglobus sp.]
MSEAKHPRGITFTQSYRWLSFHKPSKHFMVAAATGVLVAITAIHTQFNNRQSQEWVHFEHGLLSAAPGEQQASITPIPTPKETATLTATIVEPAPPVWSNQVVKSGDTLSQIFKRAGYSEQDVQNVIDQAQDGKSLERLFPGQTIAFRADDSGDLTGVRHIKSALETVTYLREDDGFKSQVEFRTPEVREAWTTGVITSSLSLAGQEAGLSQRMILEMANIFGGVVDFALDPRRGDTIELVYEELYLDGEKYGEGDIIAASFTNRGETFNAFRYTDSNGDTNYYNEEGVSMRKAFLMAPLDFTRVSSNFNMHRMHPIYKTVRPHRGTDYAAPTGTPVYAAGDGRVSKAGYSSTSGNYVFIQHGEQYVTKYLHLQKRVVDTGGPTRNPEPGPVGTVGSTPVRLQVRTCTEFLVNGVNRNPYNHKELPKASVLPGTELASFHQAINRVNYQLAVLRSNNHLAMNNAIGSSDSPN